MAPRRARRSGERGGWLAGLGGRGRGYGAGRRAAPRAAGAGLVTVGALGGVPLLLITALALVAVYSPDPDRRAAAEKILDRLLATLRQPPG